jgi:hypothetical protein
MQILVKTLRIGENSLFNINPAMCYCCCFKNCWSGTSLQGGLYNNKSFVSTPVIEFLPISEQERLFARKLLFATSPNADYTKTGNGRALSFWSKLTNHPSVGAHNNNNKVEEVDTVSRTENVNEGDGNYNNR